MKKLIFTIFLISFISTAFSQIQVNSGFKVAAQQSVDDKQYKLVNNKHVPYADTSDFLATIPKTRRHIGQMAFVKGTGNKIDIWQFQGGIEQVNLIKFFTDVAIALNRPHPVQTIAEMLALDPVVIGDVATVADSSKSWILRYEPATDFGNWVEILNPLISSTDYLPEGSTNKYDTEARNRDAINSGVGIGYNKTTGVITNLFDPIAGKNMSITGTMPTKTFAVTGIYDITQSDSISTQIRNEIQIAAGGGITYSQLDSTAVNIRDSFPTDYFNNRTISADSLYDILERKDGTKDTTIYVAGDGDGGGGGGGGGIQSIVAGTNVTVDATDPSNPIVNAVMNAIQTASNGLTRVGDDVQLGGILSKNTEINSNGYYLRLLGGSTSVPTMIVGNSIVNSVSAMSVYNYSNVLAAIHISNSGLGAGIFSSSSSGYGIISATSTSDTANIYSALLIKRSTGSGGNRLLNGYGVGLDFNLQTNSTSSLSYISNRIISKWTDVSDPTRTSEFSITGVDSAVTKTLIQISGAGKTKLNQYGTGTFTGTPTYNLSVDESGNIIETVGSGSSNVAVLRTDLLSTNDYLKADPTVFTGTRFLLNTEEGLLNIKFGGVDITDQSLFLIEIIDNNPPGLYYTLGYSSSGFTGYVQIMCKDSAGTYSLPPSPVRIKITKY